MPAKDGVRHSMDDLAEFLRRPANPASAANRAASFLSAKDEFAFGSITLGDLVYDRVSIDPAALEGFEFAKPSADDIFKLAKWSEGVVGAHASTYEGEVNRLQGYVFERMAALSLRQGGAVVELPHKANNPGWDLLVNGEKVQAKCGLSPRLVTDHLEKYPGIPRVVVNEDLAAHFSDNDYVTAVGGVTRDAVRATTEHSLASAADMLDLHLGDIVPIVSVARNAYQLWRGNTDWRALPSNVSVDALGRAIGASAGHALGGAVVAIGLGGWPAILLPIFAATGGYRGGRALSDAVKRRLLLRDEYAELSGALSGWCHGASRTLTTMIARADRMSERLAAARDRSHPDYRVVIDVWRERLEAEQAFRRMHLEKFAKGVNDPWRFDEGSGPLDGCAAAMVAASRAGLFPADLAPEKRSLIAAVKAYAAGLRRRLLSR